MPSLDWYHATARIGVYLASASGFVTRLRQNGFNAFPITCAHRRCFDTTFALALGRIFARLTTIGIWQYTHVLLGNANASIIAASASAISGCGSVILLCNRIRSIARRASDNRCQQRADEKRPCHQSSSLSNPSAKVAASGILNIRSGLFLNSACLTIDGYPYADTNSFPALSLTSVRPRSTAW